MRTLPYLVLGLSALAAGCSGPRQGLELNSTQTPDRLATDPTIRTYTASDRNTADFYLTDLPPAAAQAGDLDGLTGSLVHIHLFLQPRAGHTPIADEACSFTLRQVVLSKGQVGVYSGGGFLTLKGDLGGKSIAGSFRGATVRLTQSTPGFTDRLGPSEMNGAFKAERDDRGSAGWSGLLSRALDACAKAADAKPKAPGR